jgi:hypothetical protein
MAIDTYELRKRIKIFYSKVTPEHSVPEETEDCSIPFEHIIVLSDARSPKEIEEIEKRHRVTHIEKIKDRDGIVELADLNSYLKSEDACAVLYFDFFDDETWHSLKECLDFEYSKDPLNSVDEYEWIFKEKKKYDDFVIPSCIREVFIQEQLFNYLTNYIDYYDDEDDFRRAVESDYIDAAKKYLPKCEYIGDYFDFAKETANRIYDICVEYCSHGGLFGVDRFIFANEQEAELKSFIVGYILSNFDNYRKWGYSGEKDDIEDIDSLIERVGYILKSDEFRDAIDDIDRKKLQEIIEWATKERKKLEEMIDDDDEDDFLGEKTESASPRMG